jgi:hypothetical protein
MVAGTLKQVKRMMRKKYKEVDSCHEETEQDQEDRDR